MFLISSSPFLLFCVSYAICLLTTANGVRWPTPEQEALDERNDFEMLKAVQQSMLEWRTKSHHKHNRRKREDKRVCYGDLGCFEDSGPFGYLDMLPSSPEEINTKFYFYSTKDRGDQPLAEFSYFDIPEALGIEKPELSTEIDSSNNVTTVAPPLPPTTTTVTTGMTSPTTTTTTTTTPTTPTATTKSPIKQSLDRLEGLENLSTRVIVHGFGSSCPHVWIYEMRTALMAVEDCIVLCVDWENGAALPNYVKAAANARLVGKQIAMLLMGLEKYKNLEMARVHIIGFSLGAHAAGFAGAELPGLNRITGLDPAGPLFESQHPKARLDSTDANFVDVIHSNGENLILGGLGSWQPMGHVDFYPNGGRVQHGCSNLFVGAVTDFIWSPTATVEGRSLCNHRRAYKFFIDSVAPRCLFPAFPCNTYDDFLQGNCFPCDKANKNSSADARCGNMGYYADRSTGRGQLYLNTREEEPFCAHQYNIEIHSALSELPLRTLGRIEVTLIGGGGLNETFTITEKDDSEFFAGELISRILVPHPALGFPTNIALTYKSYSGWLSRGLPLWHVYKVILTDSFGKSYSICKRYFSLESGKSEHLSLLPGNCHIPEEVYELEDIPRVDNVDRADQKNEENEVNHNYDSHKLYKKNVQDGNLGDDEHNEVTLSWQPVFDGNGLDKDIAESSRGFPNVDEEDSHKATEEIVEPVLKGNRHKNGKGRKLDGFNDGEITEPVLKSTTQRIIENTSPNDISHRRKSVHQSEEKPRDGGFMTVQLLPFRLGEILEKAERYARLTLLPLISENAPRFFTFGIVSNDEEDKERKSRYFSFFANNDEDDDDDDDDDDDRIKKSSSKQRALHGLEGDTGSGKNVTKTTHIDILNDNEAAISPRNILETLRDNNDNKSDAKVIQQRSISDQIYYTNLHEMTRRPNQRQHAADDDRLTALNEFGTNDVPEVIRIDLPTYRPPVTFPYPFELPTSTPTSPLSSDHNARNEEKSDEKSEEIQPSNTREERTKFIPLTYRDPTNAEVIV